MHPIENTEKYLPVLWSSAVTVVFESIVVFESVVTGVFESIVVFELTIKSMYLPQIFTE